MLFLTVMYKRNGHFVLSWGQKFWASRHFVTNGISAKESGSERRHWRRDTVPAITHYYMIAYRKMTR
jgi:hypothetical protein